MKLWGGVPAKHIKWRTDTETIEFLLKFRWWDKNQEEIEKIKPMLQEILITA